MLDIDVIVSLCLQYYDLGHLLGIRNIHDAAEIVVANFPPERHFFAHGRPGSKWLSYFGKRHLNKTFIRESSLQEVLQWGRRTPQF